MLSELCGLAPVGCLREDGFFHAALYPNYRSVVGKVNDRPTVDNTSPKKGRQERPWARNGFCTG